jgi:hypothetical protein
MVKIFILIGIIGLAACNSTKEQTNMAAFYNKIEGHWILSNAVINNQHSDLLAGVYAQFYKSKMTSNLISLLTNGTDSASLYSIQEDSIIKLNIEPPIKILKLEQENMILNFNYNKNTYNLFFNKQ